MILEVKGAPFGARHVDMTWHDMTRREDEDEKAAEAQSMRRKEEKGLTMTDIKSKDARLQQGKSTAWPNWFWSIFVREDSNVNMHAGVNLHLHEYEG